MPYRRAERYPYHRRLPCGRGIRPKGLPTEINHALIVRLATEFNGFCRDPHDTSIETIVKARDPRVATENFAHPAVAAATREHRLFAELGPSNPGTCKC